MYGILFSSLCNWQDCYAQGTFLAAEGHMVFSLCAKAKMDLALNLLAALPQKTNSNCLLILPAIQAICPQELHL